jgi:hypothetical protein
MPGGPDMNTDAHYPTHWSPDRNTGSLEPSPDCFKHEETDARGDTVTFAASNDAYRISISVSRKDGSELTKEEAEQIYTNALGLLR